MIAYGTPIFLQSAGRKMTSSMGSTSFGMSTNAVFFASMSATI
jgi:hypothetical protein